MYRSGTGVEQDLDESVRLFNGAIERGNIFAPAQLARMYRNGWGVEKSAGKAFELYQLSAERGFSGAWLSLGEMHESGEAGRQDPGEAYFNYLVAQKIALERRKDDPNFKESQERAGQIAGRLADPVRRQQERRAEQWVALNGQSLRFARHAFQ
jgi:TPR repeat protein